MYNFASKFHKYQVTLNWKWNSNVEKHLEKHTPIIFVSFTSFFLLASFYRSILTFFLLVVAITFFLLYPLRETSYHSKVKNTDALFSFWRNLILILVGFQREIWAGDWQILLHFILSMGPHTWPHVTSLLLVWCCILLKHGSSVSVHPSVMHVSVLRYFKTAPFSFPNDMLFIFISENTAFGTQPTHTVWSMQ